MSKWKRKLSILLIALFTVVFFAGRSICANASTDQKIKKSKITKSTKKNPKIKPAAKKQQNKKPLKVVLLINGTLGDKSYFDSATNGMKMISNQLGAQTKVIEMSYDQTMWLPVLEDVSKQDWDIIIAGTYQMQEYLEKVAPEHKDKKYITFDNSVEYDKGNLDNVCSILYKQNEGSFLAGALAAKITESNMPQANNDKVIGFLGGMDTPVINDFLVGYIEGARYVDKDIKVAISYTENFTNPEKGKEMALEQFNNQKVDIAFSVAGQTDLGLLDAAKDSKKYAIGSDSDMSMQFKDFDLEKANLITTSVEKRIDNSLLRVVKITKEGKLKYGSAQLLGVKEEAIQLSDNEFYRKNVPQDIREYVKGLEKDISNGKIKVDTALGMRPSDLNKLKNVVKP